MNDPNEPSAESLMRRFVGRDDATAFDEIVSRFLTPALGAARQVLSDPALAEDAVQEAFLRVVRCRTQYLQSSSFAPWFYTILRNVCKDMLRRAGRDARLVSEMAHRVSTQDPPHEFESTVPASQILSVLPDRERAVLTLRIVYDLPFPEVAAALGISYEAARKRAQRGLRRLRRSGRLAEFAARPDY